MAARPTPMTSKPSKMTAIESHGIEASASPDLVAATLPGTHQK